MRRSSFVFAIFVLSCRGSDPVETAADAHEPDVAVLEDSSSHEAEVAVDAEQDVAIDAPPAKPKTIVRVHYPAGSKTLALRGSTAPWSWDKGVAMKHEGGDTWTLETDALTAPAEWKPLLDDATWSRGPNYRVEPGKTVDVYPHFTITKGKVEKRWPTFASTTLGNTRAVWVYLPPTYLENATARFPVVYMHDGQNLFDPSLAFGGNEWKVDETIDAAAESGSFPEAIVIGPENAGSARMYEYTPTKDPGYPSSGGGEKYLSMLVTELKPKVDAELRTLAGRETTVVIGSSLGGLISAWAGATHTSTFGLIGAMSPSTWWNDRVLLGKVASMKGGSLPIRVYVDSGDSGPSSDDMANTKLLADAYRGVGYVDDDTLKYVVQKGAVHNEIYWAQRLPGALRFLLGPGR